MSHPLPRSASIAHCLQRSGELADHSDSARLDLELLLCKVLEKPRAYLYTWPERILSEDELARFEALLAERKKGKPVAHLLGEKEFWSLNLRVNESTLIPRPETELLVEAALSLPLRDKASVLDLGTGTGAIALALASERPGWQLSAVDSSEEALRLARENCRQLALSNVNVMQSDWFAALGDALVDSAFDLIVANPPYIDVEDPHLQQGDLRFEPHSALVAGEQGLADLRHIANETGNHLLPGGWLLVEHGFEQGAAVRELFVAAGFQCVETRKDLGGRERLTLGRRAAES